MAPSHHWPITVKQSARTHCFWVDDAHAGGISARTDAARSNLQAFRAETCFRRSPSVKPSGPTAARSYATRQWPRSFPKGAARSVATRLLPLPLVSATLTALELCQRPPSHTALQKYRAVLETPRSPRPPNTSLPSSPSPQPTQRSLRRQLLAAGIYPPHIKYPGGPAAGYFRFAISSQHSSAQIKKLAAVLAEHAASLLK